MKFVKYLLLLIWLIFAIPTILTWISSYEFKEDSIRVIFTFTFSVGFLLILSLFTNNKQLKRILYISAFSIFILTAIILRISNILHFGTGYVTQDLIYVHKENANKRIEFQMEDAGALGYNKRTVTIESCYIFLNRINEIDLEKIDKKEWKYIGEFKNELQIKMP